MTEKYESDSREEAYLDRNLLAVAFARAAMKEGLTAGIRNWSPDWDLLYIDLPEGQVSWHIPAGMAQGFPEYGGQWDGHTLDQKRERLRSYIAMPEREGKA